MVKMNALVKPLVLVIVVLVLALLFVGVGWLIGRAPANSPSVTRQDLAEEFTSVHRHVDERADGLERKLDALLRIATNPPPDMVLR